MWLLNSLIVLHFITAAQAAVTVYGQVPLAHAAQTSSALGSAPTPTLPAYDDTVLNPPAIPQGEDKAGTAFTLSLQQNRANMFGLSIPQRGDFFGFSIEMSVINQVLGKNSTHLHPQFLNLMGNIQQRAGAVRVRLGGNTQERASMIDFIPDGRVIGKGDKLLTATTGTPDIVWTIDMLYMAANVSSHVNVQWFLGIPFNDTVNWRMQIAEYGQEILGDHLIGLQAGNEPDLYERHERRPPPWGVPDYFREFGLLVQEIDNNPRIPRKNILLGPSIASADWQPQMVWDSGYLEAYGDHLSIITVENYPNNNCVAAFNVTDAGPAKVPQDEFPQYLSHNSPVERCLQYLPSTALAQTLNKPFMMFETNTASCGGFPGLSDTYGAALWALDYGMQMAYSNFTGALLHVGGQKSYYNPFTSPPTNQSTFHEWTVGAVYYSALIISEVFGNTNNSRILDLLGNNANRFTPQYAIYDNDVLSRVALFNYVTDPSGQSDYVASIVVQGGTVPASVAVKYFESDSVSRKYNLTWAGQTLGNKFEVDGRLKGELNIVTINCDIGANRCDVPVKAPGFALVFMQADAPQLSLGESTITFETTAFTKTANTMTIDPSVLATSNGMSGMDRTRLGSSSKGSVSGGMGLHTFVPGLAALLSMATGGAFVLMAFTT